MKVRIKKQPDLYETGEPEYAIEVSYPENRYTNWMLLAVSYDLKLAKKIKKLIEDPSCDSGWYNL